MAAPAVLKGDEVSFGRINAQAISGHPIDCNFEVRCNKVGGLCVITSDHDEGTVVHVELCSTIHPVLCQAKKWSSVEGG
jgi:hypothetical protein